MTGQRSWTVLVHRDVADQILAWAKAGGPQAQLAQHAKHCLQLLRTAGPTAGDGHKVKGVSNLHRIRVGNVRVYFDTAPDWTITAAVVEQKKGEHPQTIYQQYARRVAVHKAAIAAGER